MIMKVPENLSDQAKGLAHALASLLNKPAQAEKLRNQALEKNKDLEEREPVTTQDMVEFHQPQGILATEAEIDRCLLAFLFHFDDIPGFMAKERTVTIGTGSWDRVTKYLSSELTGIIPWACLNGYLPLPWAPYLSVIPVIIEQLSRNRVIPACMRVYHQNPIKHKAPISPLLYGRWGGYGVPRGIRPAQQAGPSYSGKKIVIGSESSTSIHDQRGGVVTRGSFTGRGRGYGKQAVNTRLSEGSVQVRTLEPLDLHFEENKPVVPLTFSFAEATVPVKPEVVLAQIRTPVQRPRLFDILESREQARKETTVSTNVETGNLIDL